MQHQFKQWANFDSCCRTLNLMALLWPPPPVSNFLAKGKWYAADVSYCWAEEVNPIDVYRKALIIFDPATGQFEFNIPTNLIMPERLEYMKLCSMMMTFAYEEPSGKTSAKAEAQSEAQAQA